MRLSRAINCLISEGTISRVRVNRYIVNGTARVNRLGIPTGAREYTRERIAEMFLVRLGENNYTWRHPTTSYSSTEFLSQLVNRNYITTIGEHYHINTNHMTDMFGIVWETVRGRTFSREAVLRIFGDRVGDTYTLRAHADRSICSLYNISTFGRDSAESTPTYAESTLRRITRGRYHSNGDGTNRTGIDEALRAIARDEDGVRRSYGLEWEIQNMTAEQEDKLARLLDTLPKHFTEEDGSLNREHGVEIVFLPLGKEKIIEVWNKLQSFCRENHMNMTGTGAHLTYGVSNTEITNRNDLQIRLNRIALAVKAASTQRQIRDVFGRDFTGYAQLPHSTTESGHSMSWSASRGFSAYELRLCAWEGNINKIVDFMEKTEFVFHRPFRGQDFINIFNVMGCDCAEA